MAQEKHSEQTVAALVENYFRPENQPREKRHLPVNAYWNEILASIRKYPVTIITGPTGCGKTTQVPQLLLEHELHKNRRTCRMVVTQPRRIAAISVANAVCANRNWDVGSICGYQVGMDREWSRDTCIEYVTTNILVEKIIHNKSIEPYTHVIVDEIHERHQDLDCLLFLLRKHDESWGSRPKIILMSATAEADTYSQYFGEDQCSLVRVQGSVYAVETLYLEDLPSGIRERVQAVGCGARARDRKGQGEDATQQSNKALILQPDAMRAVGDLIETFDKKDADSGQALGAVLVFLPGVAEINRMIRILSDYEGRCSFELIPLHSRIPQEAQRRVFWKAPPRTRKIIVATNIAESSITVPDIRYVIDFCLTKNQVMDDYTNFTSYQIESCSRANCSQRAGRAGRVQNGIVYRLVSKEEYKAFREYPIPEMQRCPVDISVLKIKTLGLSEPKRVLQEFIDPPAKEDVARAILNLKEIQAMQLEHNGQVDIDDGDLTILGTVMAKLPLDMRLSKLILMGFALGSFDECVKIAACLSVENIMLIHDDPLANYKNKLRWAEGSFSDPLMLMHAFDEFLKAKENDSGDDVRRKRGWAREEGLQLSRLMDVYHLYEDLKQRLSQIGFSKPQTPNLKERDKGLQNFFVMIALCGAFYPHYYALNPVESSSIRSVMGDHDPSNTMIISGLPDGHGPLYAQAIRAALRECLQSEVRLSFRSMYAYLTFENHDNDGIPLDAYLCEVYRRKKAIVVPRVPEETARRLLQQRDIFIDGDRRYAPEITVLQMSQNMARNIKQVPPPPRRIQSGVLQSEDAQSKETWSVKGTITCFLDMLTFCMIPDERLPRLQEVQNEIQDELKNYRENLIRLEEAEIGMLVLAEYEGEFCRARVVLDSPKGPRLPQSKTSNMREKRPKIAVLLIDFGNRDHVSYVYKLPETMLLCNDEAPFAWKAQLAHVKLPDGVIRKPLLVEQYLSRNKKCRAEIFAIVDDTLRVKLFLEIDDEEVCMNDRLVYEKHVIQDQESDSSQQRSDTNIVQNSVLRGEDFVDLSMEGQGMITLEGPRSLLANASELKPLSKGSVEKRVEITPQSINNVLFGSTSNYQQFVVGHMTRLSSDLKRVQLLQCTLMTKLPMMLPFVALVFSPRAQYQCNERKTKYIGAICGMGGRKNDNKTFTSVREVSDLEVPFSQELDGVDVKLINEIRRLLREAFCGNTTIFQWSSVPILKIQKKIEEYTLRFFNREGRKPIERDYRAKTKFEKPLGWTKLKKALCLKDPDRDRRDPFRPHSAELLRDEFVVELFEVYSSFIKSISRNEQDTLKTLCPLCCETFDCNVDALEHIRSRKHELLNAILRGKHHDED